MEWYTVHIPFAAKDDRDALIRAQEIVKSAAKHSKTYVARRKWDVSTFEDWAEIIRTARPGDMK